MLFHSYAYSLSLGSIKLHLSCSALLQLGPNADIVKWEEEQMGIATVRFGAKDAKEKSKVCFPGQIGCTGLGGLILG